MKKEPKPKKRMIRDVVNAFMSVLDRRVMPVIEIRKKLLDVPTDMRMYILNDDEDVRIVNANWMMSFNAREAMVEGMVGTTFASVVQIPGYTPDKEWGEFSLLQQPVRDALTATHANYFKMSFGRRSHTNTPAQFELNMSTNIELDKIFPVLPVTQAKVTSLLLGSGRWQPVKGSNIRYRYPARMAGRMRGNSFNFPVPKEVRPNLGTEFNMTWDGAQWPSDEEVIDTTERMLDMWIADNADRVKSIYPDMIKKAVDDLDNSAINWLAFGIINQNDNTGGHRYRTNDECSAIDAARNLGPVLLSHPKLQKAIATGVAKELNHV